jgi:transcription elongation factor Elf1
VSQPVTHRCERCGREYIWVNPSVKNPVDTFGNSRDEICKGRLISVNDYPFSQYHAADVPYESKPESRITLHCDLSAEVCA